MRCLQLFVETLFTWSYVMLGSRFVSKAILAALMTICPDLADAQGGKDAPANAAWSAGVMLSTLGPGLQISYRVLDWAVVRAEGSYISVPTDDLTLSLQSAGAMLDLHPFESGFRISGGCAISNTRSAGSPPAAAPRRTATASRPRTAARPRHTQAWASTPRIIPAAHTSSSSASTSA